MRKLSIVIPIYNEEKTLAKLLDKVVALKMPEGWDKEILLCNDASQDGSQDIIDAYTQKYNYIKSVLNRQNLGKSQTVRRGILDTTGDFVVIQDADLEYEPEDIVFMLERVVKESADVAYGNRFGMYNGVIYWQNFLGNLGLSCISNIFTLKRIRVFIPDMEVCYKLIKGGIARDLAEKISATSNFGFEPEITAKLGRYCKNVDHLKFLILPIHYYPRSIEEGKKMNAIPDGIKALFEIIRYNLWS